MSRYASTRCTVCNSPASHLVDAGLIAGASAKLLATQYGLGERSVARHRTGCLPHRLAEAQRVTETAALTAEQLIAQVTEVQHRALKLADKAERSGDIKEQAQAIRELRSTVELLAKLSFAAADRAPASSTEERPDIDALIVEQLGGQAPELPQPLALGAGDLDDEVAEAELV